MELWMSIVGISMALGGAPQIYRMWKRKTSDDISLTLWIVMSHGILWWLYYGITIGSISLIITNSVCITLDSVILTMIIRYRTKLFFFGRKKCIHPGCGHEEVNMTDDFRPFFRVKAHRKNERSVGEEIDITYERPLIKVNKEEILRLIVEYDAVLIENVRRQP